MDRLLGFPYERNGSAWNFRPSEGSWGRVCRQGHQNEIRIRQVRLVSARNLRKVMIPITTAGTREIVRDFASEIARRKFRSGKPEKTVINFRTDRKVGKEREIWCVPIELLRYRKDNGRIASDVLDHERSNGPLDEQDEQAQAHLARFLEQKDPEKTARLKDSILHDGQLEPAIITCDGFLINGNRRKMVLQRLRPDHPDDPEFSYMRVVILPGEGDEGGPPTLLEIEKIENRYQLQDDGKSEYYGFDRALSIKRKIKLGLSLEEQLRDDPQFADSTPDEIQKAVKKYTQDYLAPLECVDLYLRQFRREGQYRTISAGMSDPEGRWQAFIDYSATKTRHLVNPTARAKVGIEEDEVGAIEEAAFDIIRLRNLPDQPKVHVIMRELPKLCEHKEGKAALLKIAEIVEPLLPAAECRDDKGDALNSEKVDAKWVARNQQVIICQVRKARKHREFQKERETPLELLEAALKKLNHEDLDLSGIGIGDYGQARKLAAEIQKRAKEIEHEIYNLHKKVESLRTHKP